MCLDPGVELLVKVVCDASERPWMAEKADIRPGSAGNWLVCIPLDQFDGDGLDTSRYGPPQYANSLRADDLLLVPKYLTEIPSDPRYQAYRRIRCFRSVRIIGRSRWPRINLQDRSAVTAVLPDHFYTGQWSQLEERFPLNSPTFVRLTSNSRRFWPVAGIAISILYSSVSMFLLSGIPYGTLGTVYGRMGPSSQTWPFRINYISPFPHYRDNPLGGNNRFPMDNPRHFHHPQEAYVALTGRRIFWSSLSTLFLVFFYAFPLSPMIVR